MATKIDNNNLSVKVEYTRKQIEANITALERKKIYVQEELDKWISMLTILNN